MLGMGAAHAQELPDTMSWTSYDVGSAGYAEASAIADAFGKQYAPRAPRSGSCWFWPPSAWR